MIKNQNTHHRASTLYFSCFKLCIWPNNQESEYEEYGHMNLYSHLR